MDVTNVWAAGIGIISMHKVFIEKYINVELCYLNGPEFLGIIYNMNSAVNK